MADLRAVGWMAAGVVVGFMLGGVPGERARVELEQRVSELERSLSRSERPNILSNFLPQLGRPTAADDRRPAHAWGPDAGAQPLSPSEEGHADRTLDERPEARGDVAVIGGDKTGADAPTAPARPRPPGGGSFSAAFGGSRDGQGDGDDEATPLERFDQAASVQRARASASRSALISQARLGPEQVERLDGTLSEMNAKLAGYGDEMIDQMGRGEPPAPAQALELGHDISGILLDGQKELDAIVGDAADDVEPSALEVWNYVDVEQWRPTVEQRIQEEAAAAPAEGGAGSGPASSGESTAPAAPTTEDGE